MKKYLIVVDMQNDFITGSLGTKEAVNIIPKVVNKIESYTNKENVFFTLDTHEEDTYLDSLEGKHLPIKHCIRDTEGHELQNDISCINGIIYDNYITLKSTYHYNHMIRKNTFGSTDLVSIFNLNLFKNVIPGEPIEIEIVGLCTDICVISTALLFKSTFPEVKISVDADCCAGTTPEMHKAALLVMKSCQIDIEGQINDNEYALLVVGSRSFNNIEYMRKILDDELFESEDKANEILKSKGYSFKYNSDNALVSKYLNNKVTIISGGANGADTLAEMYAFRRGIETKIFPANWKLYGKKAGFLRNEQMHEYIAKYKHRKCIAFWDGLSKGTSHNFELAKKYNTPMEICLYKTGEIIYQ